MEFCAPELLPAVQDDQEERVSSGQLWGGVVINERLQEHDAMPMSVLPPRIR
jgi:hypothetical protein